MTSKFSDRFAELIEEANKIEAHKHVEQNPLTNAREVHVDRDSVLTWRTKAKHLLVTACGSESVHVNFFESVEKQVLSSPLRTIQRMRAVLIAAQNDYDGGFLAGTRSIVQAEVFGSELEQAEELLRSGYKVPAAVIAGTVLETHLRELCTRASIPHGKADKMNADLVKAGVYGQIQAKRVTALVAIRNSAAHGEPSGFTDQEVKGMIEDIERFLAQYP